MKSRMKKLQFLLLLICLQHLILLPMPQFSIDFSISLVHLAMLSYHPTPQYALGYIRTFLGPLFVLFMSPIANVMNPDLSNTNNLVSFQYLFVSFIFWYKVNYAFTSSLFNRILQTEGSQLAPGHWSKSEAIDLSTS